MNKLPYRPNGLWFVLLVGLCPLPTPYFTPPLTFNHGSRDTLYLHPFPTRRSSDLDYSTATTERTGNTGHNHGGIVRSESGSAGMPRPISFAVFWLKKKKDLEVKLVAIDLLE